MTTTRDYYEILELGRGASAAELKKSFRRLALAHHPDRNDAPESEAHFKLINEAYAVLSDPEKRRRYDRYGVSRGGDETGRERPSGVSERDLRDVFGDEVFNQLFSSLFRSEPNASQGSRGHAAPKPPIETQLVVTLESTLREQVHTLSVQRESVCRACNGRGGSGISCSPCRGHGQIREQRGFLTIPCVCPTCGGSGLDPKSRCRVCGGRGVTMTKADVDIRVPPGVLSGEVISIMGEGHYDSQSKSGRGALLVTVDVSPHALFERSGEALITHQEISYETLALGGALIVPLLDGGEAKVTIPSGFDISKALRLRGQGLPINDHSVSEEDVSRTSAAPPIRGDLLVHLRIKIPKVLTATERELLVALRRVRASTESITSSDDSSVKSDSRPGSRSSGSNFESSPSHVDQGEEALGACPVCALRDELHDGSSRTRRIYQQLTGRIKKRGRVDL